MVDSNALLFIVPQTKDNHLILTGKLFEYLGSGTPLISIAPPKGNAAKIIAETKSSALTFALLRPHRIMRLREYNKLVEESQEKSLTVC